MRPCLGENKKMSYTLIAIQKEQDFLKARLDIYEKEEKEDVWILDIKCEGNCDPVIHQAQEYEVTLIVHSAMLGSGH